MKKVNVKDLNQAQIIYKATKFFSANGNAPAVGFWVIKTVATTCGIDNLINDYRRAYAVEQALENSDSEVSFLQRSLKDTYDSAFAQVKDHINSMVELDWEDRVTVERFLEALNPDIYDETGARQTLID